MATMPADPPNEGETGDEPDQQRPVRRRAELRAVMEVSQWQGPIPPPEVVRELDAIIPNGADRIFKQFESETAHRHKLESRKQLFAFLDQISSRVVALLFALACLGAVLYAIDHKAEWAATAIGGALIVAGINAFLRQRRSGD